MKVGRKAAFKGGASWNTGCELTQIHWGKLGRTVTDWQSHLTYCRLTHTLPARILPPLCSPLLVRRLRAPAGPMWRCLKRARGTQSSLTHTVSQSLHSAPRRKKCLWLLQQRLECLGRKTDIDMTDWRVEERLFHSASFPVTRLGPTSEPFYSHVVKSSRGLMLDMKSVFFARNLFVSVVWWPFSPLTQILWESIQPGCLRQHSKKMPC